MIPPRRRLSVALFVVFLYLTSSSSEETSSADGWLLVATRHNDETNIVFQCHLSHANSTIELTRGEDPCADEVFWYEGSTVIQDPRKVTRGGVSTVNLTLSATDIGKYACQVLAGREMLTVSMWLVPEGVSSEFIVEELYSVGDRFSVHCPGDLFQICLTSQCAEVHNNTGTMTLPSDQFKFFCIVEGKGLVNVTYVLPDYQPIRLLQPQIQEVWPVGGGKVVIPCEATGSPPPRVAILRRDTNEEMFVNIELYDGDPSRFFQNHSEGYISYVIKNYVAFFDSARYLCRAENIWEQRNVTVYVGEGNPNPGNCSRKDPNTPTPTPVHNVEVEVDVVPIVQVGDTVGIQCVIRLGMNYTDPPSLPGVWWEHNNQGLQPSPVKPDTATNEGVLTKTLTLENVSIADAGTYECMYNVVGTSLQNSSKADLQVVAEDLVSVITNASSIGSLLVTGPSDNATNFSAVFHTHADVAPTIAAYPLRQDRAVDYLLQTISLEPQWTEREGGTRVVWVELQPSRLDNVSVVLQEEQSALLVLNVSYYTHSAVVFLNVTFLPYPSTVQPPGEDQSVLLGWLSALMVVLLMVVAAVSILAVLSCVYRRRLRYRYLHSKHIQLELVERPEERLRRKILKEVSGELSSVHLLYCTEDLTVGERLGEGAFGVVCRGDLVVNGRAIPVAIKSIKDASRLDALEEFVKELKMLQRIGQHKHIISLVGAVIKDDALHILTEYAAGGRLLSHLHKFKGTGLLWRTKVSYGLQVARGMEYLAQMKCIHCDLAARNVLLMGDGTLKVSDFGLARKLYQELYQKNVTSRTRLPLKWMALESIELHSFDSQTDVWSFGVLLWEIATLGKTPYSLLSPHELVSRLRKGQRLPRPMDCPESLYTVMRSCWLPSAEDRPKFAQLVAMMEEIVVGVLPQEYELKDPPLGMNPAPTTCSHSTAYEDSAIVSNDVSLDSSTGGYCSYCHPRPAAGEEGESSSTEGYCSYCHPRHAAGKEGESFNTEGYCSYCHPRAVAGEEGGHSSNGSTPEHSIKLRPLPQFNKMSARRLDSADSGICRNGESDLGSTSSIAFTHSAYSTGQSSAHCCTGQSNCTCGGAYASGYTCTDSSYGNSFGAWGSGTTFNLPHHQLPTHTHVQPNSLSVRHHYREQFPPLQSGVTESDV